MIDLRLGRYASGVCVSIAMLAGCGGTQPLSPSPGGVTAERTRVPAAYGVIYSFKGPSGDGAFPASGLIHLKGTLYGTTVDGGPYTSTCYRLGCGTVYAISASGNETVLHNFGGSGDGETPAATLINVKGTLYGTTIEGGTDSYGTVFSITTSGAESVLYSFKGNGDGAYPYEGLIDVNGTLYGTTHAGGSECYSTGCGTVFKITTSGKEKVVYSFKGGSGDGAAPEAGLTDVNGTLYGTTYEGGPNDEGTVFSIKTSGKEALLHSFGGYGDGANARAGVIDVNGTFYGTTYDGGANDEGTVFSIKTSGKETVLHSFPAGSGDGFSPKAALVNVKGTLYSTTDHGGVDGFGTVFAITRSGAETVLHSFGGSGDGTYPSASLIDVMGTLYGTTEYGGGTGNCALEGGCGTVFSLSP
jgi:uncharacterized repeat protein (TIGR03803 family)